MDYPISKRAFIFNLSPADKPWSIGNQSYPSYPEEAVFFDKIMQRLNDIASVWGWAEPECKYN